MVARANAQKEAYEKRVAEQRGDAPGFTDSGHGAEQDTHETDEDMEAEQTQPEVIEDPDEEMTSLIQDLQCAESIGNLIVKSSGRRRRESNRGLRFLVSEMYSPPRVNGVASALGIASGLSLDLTEADPEDGMPWDFTRKEKRDKVLDMVLGKRALLLIGSLMCTAFSKLQNWNFRKMTPEARNEIVNAGREHLKFCMLLYRIQHENGMYFLHEHPATALSWKDPDIAFLERNMLVCSAAADQCRYGLVTPFQEDKSKLMPAIKPTRSMSNSQIMIS